MTQYKTQEIGDLESQIDYFNSQEKPVEKTYEDYRNEFKVMLFKFATDYLKQNYGLELDCQYLIKEFNPDGDKYPELDYKGEIRHAPQKGESVIFRLCKHRIMYAFIYRSTGNGNCYNYVRYFYIEHDIDGYFHDSSEFPFDKVSKEISERIDEFCSRLIVEKNKQYAINKIKQLEEEIEHVKRMYEI
jgi:hypothetical protein